MKLVFSVSNFSSPIVPNWNLYNETPYVTPNAIFIVFFYAQIDVLNTMTTHPICCITIAGNKTPETLAEDLRKYTRELLIKDITTHK